MENSEWMLQLSLSYSEHVLYFLDNSKTCLPQNDSPYEIKKGLGYYFFSINVGLNSLAKVLSIPKMFTILLWSIFFSSL